MTPLSLLVPQKLAGFLEGPDGIVPALSSLLHDTGSQVPLITTNQIVLSSASPDFGDRNIQLTYPRICLYSSNVKNAGFEKFRSFSGSVTITADVWASANLIYQTDEWIHYYVEAVLQVLQNNRGDWGDGVFFSGQVDVQFQPPKNGGLGYVQSARITCVLTVSQN